MDGDVESLFIGISVSHVSIGTQEYCLPKLDDLIAFKHACSSALSKCNMTNISCLAIN